MPCGMGKTRVLSEFLKSRLVEHPASVVILVSPFRVQAEQIIERVGNDYLPTHRKIIVDSDTNRTGSRKTGNSELPLRTTSLDKLRNEMFDLWGRLKKPCLISTTFASLVNVIDQYLFTDKNNKSNARNYVLVIDEAHNITCKAARVVTNASKLGVRTLLITATPGKVMQSRFEEDFLSTVYSFSMSKAIEKKYVCDYCIIIPELVLVKEEKDDKEDNDDDTEDSAQSNSRGRNRTRLTTRINMELPQELKDSYTNMTERKKWKINEKSYNQLAPQCLFLANGMMKYGCRRCIVFCSNMEKCAEFCDVFIEVCALYHGIRHVFAASIISSTPASKRKEKQTEFQAYTTSGSLFLCILANVRILSEGVNLVACDSVFLTSTSSDPEGITSIQRMCRANRVDPNHPGKVAHCFVWADDADKTAIALHTLKYASGDAGSLIYEAEDEGMQSLARRIHMLKNEYDNDSRRDTPQTMRRSSGVQTSRQCAKEWLVQKIENVKCVGFEDRWRTQFRELQTFVEHNDGKKPQQTSDDPREKQLASLLYTQQRNWANNQGIMRCEEIFVQWETFITDDKDLLTYQIKGWETSLGITRLFLADHVRLPSLTSEDAHEARIALWIQAQLKRYAQGTSALMALSVIRCQWWKFLAEFAEFFEDDMFVWEFMMTEVQTFISQKNTRPSSASCDAHEKRLATWVSAQQYKYISTTGIMQDPRVRAEWNAFLKKNEAFYEDNISVWKRTFREVQEFIRANKRRPVQNAYANEARLAQWILSQEWSYAHKAFFLRNAEVRAQWEHLTQIEHAALFDKDDCLNEAQKDAAALTSTTNVTPSTATSTNVTSTMSFESTAGVKETKNEKARHKTLTVKEFFAMPKCLCKADKQKMNTKTVKAKVGTEHTGRMGCTAGIFCWDCALRRCAEWNNTSI
eukprot:6182161-Pleurochrysis_carterae.AAC.1